jgi:predicted Zn-ribbon and HTH transcriptional regulator
MSQKSGKTIRELADELGVSKTAIMNEIEKQDLRKTLRKVGNRFVVPNTTIMLINSAFIKRNDNNSEDSMPMNLQSIIAILEDQLEQKDRQIADLIKQLAETNKTALQAQALHANVEQKLLAEKVEAEPTKKKKSWWKFRKNKINN